MKILIVDDCQTTRKLLSLYLKSAGFEVVTAENGIDALEKIGRDNINLVLSDLNMPFMDGIELVKNIRTMPELRDLPVIMVTTEADEKEKKAAYEAGATGYMVKPVTADAISKSIKDILKGLFNRGGNNA